MADQTQRLEIATVRAEVGGNILFRFGNDALAAAPIPTDSGPIQNIKQVVADIQEDAADKISIATTIYQTPAAGLAATTDGGIFLVQSSDADEIYAVWKNEAGAAVNTGKTAMSSQAVQTALDASNEAAQAAEDAADVATTRTAGFLAPAAVPPVTRDDGLPLQVGDRYFNTEDESEYLYKSGAWAANDSIEAIDAITDGGDPAKGAALIPYDGTDLGAQTLLSRKLANYAALRAYAGLASRVEITQSGVAGDFIRLGVVGGYVDNGATIIVGAGGVVWIRQFYGALALDWFQPDKTGVVDAQPAVDAWLKILGALGGSGVVSDGKYSLSTGVTTALTASFSVTCSPGAEFIAASGFPGAGVKMVAISTGLTPNQSFSWRGGRFDSHNQPYDVAYANDTFSVNATNCSMCHVELDRVYSGPDWLNSGSDSHLFIGGPSSIFARIYESIGARDTGIYISRNFAGTAGQFADVDGNFSKCNGAVIVKRRFESGRFHATAVDCVTGVSTGTADITDYASANSGHGFEVGVNAKRVEHPLFLNAASCVKGFVNAEQMGVSIAGYSSASSSAARFRGSKGCQIDVNARGVNPALTVNSDFVAAYFGPITTALDGTLNATENLVNINCSGLGVPFTESGAGTDNNTVTGKVDSMLSVFPTIVGSSTKYELQRANIKYQNGARRMVNAAGVTLFSINDDGSVSQGPQNTGVSGPAFTDFFNGQAARAARAIISGGTGVADSGTYQLNAADVVFNAPSTRTAGAFRPGQFTLTTLPSAAAFNGYEIDVTNATGGSKRCRSNGTVWQILNTTTTVS
jgi:hypothetical protein